MADDLVNRLRAALDRAERRACAATAGPWRWEGDYPKGTCPHNYEWLDHGPHLIAGEVDVATSSGHDCSNLEIKDADAEHIAAWDPSRVLRLIARDRAMLDRHAPNLDGLCHGYVWPCRDVLAAADFWLEGDTS